MATPDAAGAAHDAIVVFSRLKRRLLEVASTEGVTPTQRSVLSRLSKQGPASTSELAAAERVRPQSMAVTVAALEEGSYVERSDDPEDGRRKILTLTRDGRAFVEDLRAARHDWLAAALADECTREELTTLTRALAVLDRVVEA